MAGGGRPPGVSKLRVVELSEKTANFSQRVLTNVGALFDRMSIFDSVIGDQRSNVREIVHQSTLNAYISKSTNRRGIRLSLGYAPFNSDQNRLLLQSWASPPGGWRERVPPPFRNSGGMSPQK